ncbi:aminotransferase class IV [Curtobacterium sp. ZW137]|uniref:aminotransferase class IV n=1 Tax=Curtobacterium sp. ZW137 TaxID=2485104 RepID=UPI000F4C0338|nr:aminotransferase class IV [Curtobacterium sp. ZW137]ROP65608.1 4-amino-4-deoxychorismate lyase [Curtobacterium sp. ZW137]
MTNPVVVLIGSPTAPDSALHVVDAHDPHVDVMDLGITRGDGVFETVGIIDGRVHAVEEHLARFAHSASILDLPVPSAEAFRAAVALGVEHLDDASDAYCKYVLTRGRESGPVGRPGEPVGPTGYAYLDVNPSWERERTEGIDVVLLSRGYQLDVQTAAPWLLQGAKTLSYAVNRSVLREAARRGAEDVLFTTIDGYVLEGPTSSLVARFGDEIVTPAQSGGVLHGTAQIGAFAFFEAAGYTTTYRDVQISELDSADALWMTNSQRLAAPIRSLDGKARVVDSALTARLNEALRAR